MRHEPENAKEWHTVSNHHHHYFGSRGVLWLSKGLGMPSPSLPVLPDHVAQVQVVSPPLGWSPLSSVLVAWYPSDDTRVPSVVFEAVDMPCLYDHFIFLTLLSMSMTFVLSLTQMLVLLSSYVMLSILLTILVCTAASLFCACLVSDQVSALHVIADSIQELYTCLFRQMAMLLLKISRCLAMLPSLP